MTSQDLIVTGYAVIMLVMFFVVKLGILYILMALFTSKE